MSDDNNRDWEKEISEAKEKKTTEEVVHESVSIPESVSTDNNNTTPISDDKKEKESILIDSGDATSLDDFFKLCMNNEESIYDYLSQYGDPVKVQAAMKEPGTFDNAIAASFVHHVNQQTLFLKELISKLDDIKATLSTKNVADGVSHKTPRDYTKETGPVTLQGSDAFLELMTRSSGLRKISLVNSGFNIILRAPARDVLNHFYNNVAMHLRQIGYDRGSIFYVSTEVEIRTLFFKILKSCVVDSNLKNWKSKDTLLQTISLHDLDLLYWGMCSLIYEKIEIDCICAKCEHRVKKIIDVSKLKCIDIKKITPKRIEFISADRISSVAAYKYQEELAGYCQIDLNNNVKMILEVPTLESYMSLSRVINSKIEETLKETDDYMGSFTLHTAQMLVPWIKELHVYNEFKEDIAPEVIINDKKIIMEYLGIVDIENENFVDEFHKFIGDTKASYIAYSNMGCEKCGDATGTVDGFIPFDVQTLFFVLCYLRTIGAKIL